MRLGNIMLPIIIVFGFGGCRMGPATYEIFERNMHLGFDSNSFVLHWSKDHREVYSEDKYIYLIEGPKGCICGYFTNRDENPEKVIGWVVLSGEEYCKEQETYFFSF
jgi:hypothetical protein